MGQESLSSFSSTGTVKQTARLPAPFSSCTKTNTSKSRLKDGPSFASIPFRFLIISGRRFLKIKKTKTQLGQELSEGSEVPIILASACCSLSFSSEFHAPGRAGEGLVSWGAWKASGADSDCAELGVRIKASHRTSVLTSPVQQLQ